MQTAHVLVMTIALAVAHPIHDAHAGYQRIGAVGCTRVNSWSNSFVPTVQVTGEADVCPFIDEHSSTTMDHTEVNSLWVDFYMASTNTYGAASACSVDNTDALTIACDSYSYLSGTVGWHNANLAHTSWGFNYQPYYAYIAVFAADANAYYIGMYATT